MPDQRNGGPPSALPDLGSEEWSAQRIVVAELVVTPPTAGDPIGYLLEYLPVAPDAIEPAIAMLEAIGLAETPAARCFEHLWPVKPLSAIGVSAPRCSAGSVHAARATAPASTTPSKGKPGCNTRGSRSP